MAEDLREKTASTDESLSQTNTQFDRQPEFERKSENLAYTEIFGWLFVDEILKIFRFLFMYICEYDAA